jgi:hypothetical protein
MPHRPLLALLLTAALCDAHAAERVADEAEMLRVCSGELEERLFGAGPRGEAMIVGKDVAHEGERTVVRLDLASGEGRRISGSCVFRDGKLFDVK